MSDTNNEGLLNHYRFHWKDGKTEDAFGPDVATAFSSLGCGAGAISALDSYDVIDSNVSLVAWNDFIEWELAFWATEMYKAQRFGQAFLNDLMPKVTDAHLFYQMDNASARSYILNKYVEPFVEEPKEAPKVEDTYVCYEQSFVCPNCGTKGYFSTTRIFGTMIQQPRYSQYQVGDLVSYCTAGRYHADVECDYTWKRGPEADAKHFKKIEHTFNSKNEKIGERVL